MSVVQERISWSERGSQLGFNGGRVGPGRFALKMEKSVPMMDAASQRCSDIAIYSGRPLGDSHPTSVSSESSSILARGQGRHNRRQSQGSRGRRTLRGGLCRALKFPVSSGCSTVAHDAYPTIISAPSTTCNRVQFSTSTI